MTRGGKRKPGQGKLIGRPTLGKFRKINKNVSFRQDHIDWLKGRNASKEIELALDLYIPKPV